MIPLHYLWTGINEASLAVIVLAIRGRLAQGIALVSGRDNGHDAIRIMRAELAAMSAGLAPVAW